MYIFGSGNTPFDAKRAALAYARYRGANAQQGETSYTQEGSITADATVRVGTSDEDIDLAAWEALLIVESYFSDSLYWLPDWAERLFQLTHGACYFLHRAVFDYDSLEDFAQSLASNIVFYRTHCASLSSLVCRYDRRSPVGSTLEAYVGEPVLLPLCWLLVITILLMVMKMAITSTRRLVRICLGLCSAALVVLMLPLVLVSWLLGVKGRGKKTVASATHSTGHEQQREESVDVIRGGALSSSSRDAHDSGGGGLGVMLGIPCRHH